MKTYLPIAICYLLLHVSSALAQPQLAWVARYHGGFSNQTHTPLALKLDDSGNLYVAGTSQNASNVNEYVVLKYTPTGQQLWATRHSSHTATSFTLRGFTLDRNGNAYLTGTGGTIKYDTTGAAVWTAPYSGRDVAVDTNGNVYVTGFSDTMFATVKLDAAGSNQWVRTHAEFGFAGEPTESQKVAVDDLGHVFVAGWEAWDAWYRCGVSNYCHDSRPLMIAYDAAGTAVWTNAYTIGGIKWGQTVGLIADNQGNVYVTGNGDNYYQTAMIAENGQTTWSWAYGPPGVMAMTLASNSEVYLTGGVTSGDFTFRTGYGTFKLDATGRQLWQTNYFGTPPAFSGNMSVGITSDVLANIYVTGVSTNSGSFNDFVTIKYDIDGHQLLVLRYNGPANGNDGGTGIAVAPDGSIYVTGYSANASGGSDITTIKYASLPSIQKNSDGSIQLQFFGTPGTNCTFQSATDLLHWTDLGSAFADTGGIFQFTDTNAPSFPYRFYRWRVP